MVEWLEIIAGVIGAIGVICAFVLGYRAPRNTEPVFEIRFEADPNPEAAAVQAALIAHNPSDRPILLRSLVIQNPNRGVFFLSDAPGRSRAATFEASETSDVLAIDMEVPAEETSEIDFYVGRERGSGARELVADIEFSNTRTPSVVRSETLRARLPHGEAGQRRLLRPFAARTEPSAS